MRCFRVNPQDNVATALEDITPGVVTLLGAGQDAPLVAADSIALGHKIAVDDIAVDQPILKYGVPIGLATTAIARGQWIHLHNCRSRVDERSSQLDIQTGAPLDTVYG